ncbi:hypothetical protein MHM84_01125 [Halomonas sp. McH1-25]|uniref:hypothetical protein n=1 Tax=unclassified Halomonas TaxID=2609666 RepID=UPI001EF557F1|nr:MULTISPECIES: hypothetical protein [unclassified Halomonas]MCG7598383.1 hypothetical protein [Halomonas sp. McH1-25]MCP1342675.1 hypothetical protein [Halomonas sp. FL8]MCP1362557.1 hypothetical protein [Halomonas sp. BBD45]MCP1363723.1 hypothetical protein [Halomonas sp. BBD48]
MGTVTELRPQRDASYLDDDTQLGRTYLVLRDATYWMQLHEIAESIQARFQVVDSHAAISARIRDLRRKCGQTIMRRRRTGSTADEYRMQGGYKPAPAPQGDMFEGSAA